MFDDKNANALGSMIATRANREAVKQAQTEVDDIEVYLMEALNKIGIDMYHLPSAYKLVADARQARIDALVHARLQAVADALMTPPAQQAGDITDLAKRVDEKRRSYAHMDSLAQIDVIGEGRRAIRTQV